MESDWKIYTLEWGDPGETKSTGEEIGDFLKKLWPDDVTRVWVPRHIKTKRDVILYTGAIDQGDKKMLAVYPEGGNHHYTYGLCKTIADKRCKKYHYIHFDYHTDDAGPNESRRNVEKKGLDYELRDFLFVPHIVRDTHASSVEFVGNTWIPYVKYKKTSKPEKKAYLSLELDFMHQDEFDSRYPMGTWRRTELLEKLDEILTDHTLISADCSGYFGHEDPKSLALITCACAKIVGKDTEIFESLHALAVRGKLSYSGLYEALHLQPNLVAYASDPHTIIDMRHDPAAVILGRNILLE
jgi:hypothetical protein